MTTSQKRRWVGMSLVLAALVLGLGATAVTAAPGPAQAAVCGNYLPVIGADGEIIGWFCIPLASENPDKPDGPWAVGLEQVVNPADPWWAEHIAEGLGYLDQAAVNPREADRLRAAAQEAFLVAAERLGEGRVELGVVGVADLEHNRIEPVPQPWLVAAGNDLVDGVGLMQQALAEPEPQPWLEAGMGQFQEAYQELAQQEVIGR